MNPETAIENTRRFLDKHREQRFEDDDWVNELDALFLESAFMVDPDNLVIKKSCWQYFAFRLPVKGEIQFSTPGLMLNDMLMSVSGAVLLGKEDRLVHHYSVGDVACLAEKKKTRVKWIGGWAEEPDIEAYKRGGTCWVGQPGPEMLSPYVARALERALAFYFRGVESLNDRVPSVCLIRPQSHTKPEDASDLLFNVFVEDLDQDENKLSQFVDFVRFVLPYHLRKRFLVASAGAHSPASFQPLAEIVRKAGMEPVGGADMGRN